MKKRLYLLFVVLCVCMFVITACGSDDDNEADSEGLTVKDIAGTWIEYWGDGLETLVLKEDMTYTMNIVLYNPYVERLSEDTYSFDGTTISINYSDFGEVSEYIVTLEGDTMIWEHASGGTITYIRQ